MRILGRKFYPYKSKNRRKNTPDSAFPRTLLDPYFTIIYLYIKYESNTLIFSKDIEQEPSFVCMDRTYVWRAVCGFSEKIKLGISCELSTKQTIHMKCQAFFFSVKQTIHMKCQTLFSLETT